MQKLAVFILVVLALGVVFARMRKGMSPGAGGGCGSGCGCGKKEPLHKIKSDS